MPGGLFGTPYIFVDQAIAQRPVSSINLIYVENPFEKLNLDIDISIFLRNKFSFFYSTAVRVLTMVSSCCG